MKTKMEYRIENGTSYHHDTPQKVVDILEQCRQSSTRIVLDYGDVKTGKSWNEIYNVTGRIGRSTGNIKIPLLIYSKRSMGGMGILDHCIIGIKESKGKRVLYKI